MILKRPPRGPQEAPRRPPRCPQEAPKRPPGSPQENPRRPPRGPETTIIQPSTTHQSTIQGIQAPFAPILPCLGPLGFALPRSDCRGTRTPSGPGRPPGLALPVGTRAPPQRPAGDSHSHWGFALPGALSFSHRASTSRRSVSDTPICAGILSVFATFATRLFKLSFSVYKNGFFVEAKPLILRALRHSTPRPGGVRVSG